tara:strand:- start:200 stop:364 length:165 start_codon:yes stop_codon:yes gene_type:complete
MPKYRLLLHSGRDLIMNSNYLNDDPEDVEDLAYEALEEASFMDDYLLDIERVYD